MSHQDRLFYGIVSGCLLAAAMLTVLLISGDVEGTRVAEWPQGHHTTLR